eukprot:2005255-Prymnesium_polylepis.3
MESSLAMPAPEAAGEPPPSPAPMQPPLSGLCAVYGCASAICQTIHAMRSVPRPHLPRPRLNRQHPYLHHRRQPRAWCTAVLATCQCNIDCANYGNFCPDFGAQCAPWPSFPTPTSSCAAVALISTASRSNTSAHRAGADRAVQQCCTI